MTDSGMKWPDGAALLRTLSRRAGTAAGAVTHERCRFKVGSPSVRRGRIRDARDDPSRSPGSSSVNQITAGAGRHVADPPTLRPAGRPDAAAAGGTAAIRLVTDFRRGTHPQ